MATATDTATFSGEQLVTLALDTNNGTHTITNGTKRSDLFAYLICDAAWLLSVVGSSGPYVRVPADTFYPVKLKGPGEALVVNAKVPSSTGTLYVSVSD